MAVVAVWLWLPVQAMKVNNLRCEYLDAGGCVHTTLPPRLSWTLDAANQRGAVQSAYQILAASSPEKLKPGSADLWDSGKVPSAATCQIEFGGRPLDSFETCYWTVRVWDKDGKPGPWGKTS